MAKEYIYWFDDTGLQTAFFEAKDTFVAAGKTKNLVSNMPHIGAIYCYSDALNQWFIQNISGAKVVHITDLPNPIRALHMIST